MTCNSLLCNKFDLFLAEFHKFNNGSENGEQVSALPAGSPLVNDPLQVHAIDHLDLGEHEQGIEDEIRFSVASYFGTYGAQAWNRGLREGLSHDQAW